jgi:hypothetical protein
MRSLRYYRQSTSALIGQYAIKANRHMRVDVSTARRLGPINPRKNA